MAAAIPLPAPLSMTGTSGGKYPIQRCVCVWSVCVLGMWYSILQFINMVGVITNACLIAFTSKWGTEHDLTGQLIIVIAFEVRSVTLHFDRALLPENCFSISDYVLVVRDGNRTELEPLFFKANIPTRIRMQKKTRKTVLVMFNVSDRV